MERRRYKMSIFKSKLTIILILLIVLSAGYSQTEVSGLLNTNTTWDSTGSPYIVTGNIGIMNATLSIGPGTEIIYGQGLQMKVLTGGTLIAKAEEDKRINFIKNNTASYCNYISFEDGFIGTTLASDSTYLSGSIIDNCTFSYSNGVPITSVSTITERLLISNSVFENNNGAISYYGDLILVNNIFRSNLDGIQSHGNIHVDRNTFENTKRWAIEAKKKVVVINSTFHNNNGGIFYYYGVGEPGPETVVVKNSTFSNNGCWSYSNTGGAIFATNTSGTIYYPSGVRIENCNFTSNIGGSIGGGAIYGTGTFLNCTFIDNKSQSTKYGGAVYGSGTFINCVFKNNSSNLGSAVYASSGSPVQFQYCNFESNTGVLIVGESSVNIDSCSFINNYSSLMQSSGNKIIKRSTINGGGNIYDGGSEGYLNISNSAIKNNSNPYLVRCKKFTSYKNKYSNNYGNICVIFDSLNLTGDIFYKNVLIHLEMEKC